MSRFIYKFLAMSLQEKLSHTAALVLLSILSVGISVVPLTTILYLSGMRKAVYEGGKAVNHRDLNLAHRIGRTVASVASHTPWKSPCLIQSLCTAWILKFYTIPCVLRIGTCLTDDSLNAHAWITVGAEPIIGGDGIESFNLLAEFSNCQTVSPLHGTT
jgi:hypothetical protein